MLLCSLTLTRRQPARLIVETSASGSRVIYDAGYGPVAVEPSNRETLRNGLQRVAFPLPNRTIFKLQFEAQSQNADAPTVRSASVWTAGHLDRTFSTEDVQAQASDQIRHQIWLRLRQPLYLRRVITAENVRFSAVCLLGLAVMAGLAMAAWPLLAKAMPRVSSWITIRNRTFDRWAVLVSEDRFIRFDSVTFWFASVCGVLFVLAVLADLNGSAASRYQTDYHHGAKTRFLIGIAHWIRADEWAYSTPDIIHQVTRRDRFAVETSPLGNHSIALTGNVPVWHFSALFRPQLWGFFLLPLTYGYSFYWQAKALLLLCGVFLLLQLVTGSSRWAVFGALWYFFSPCIQWCYSWPAALPEMIGSASLATVCWCYLAVGRKTAGLMLAAVGAVLGTVNFAMCAYLPYLIPLLWLGVAIVVCWCVAHFRDVVDQEMRKERTIAALCALAVILGVGAGVYAELKPAIQFVAETLYPGRRVVPAGSFSSVQFGSHFFQWVEGETYVPAALTNICEGSGFLWFAPLTILLFITGQVRLERTQTIFLAGLWTFLLVVIAWLVLPMPSAFGTVTGFNRVTGTRALPALGLANVSIVCIMLAAIQPDRVNARRAVGVSLITSAMALGLMILANGALARYFSPAEVAACGLIWALLSVLFLAGRRRTFAAAVLLLSVFSFGVVNPIQRGLDVFTHSELAGFLKGRPELRDGNWLIYSDSAFDSGFFAAVGCKVYTGTRYLPDVDHFPLFRSRGLDVAAVNRLGYLEAVPAMRGSNGRFFVPSVWETRWEVAPDDPLLRQVGIRYLAFAVRPSAEMSAGLTPLSPSAVDGFWLYSLNGAERASE